MADLQHSQSLDAPARRTRWEDDELDLSRYSRAVGRYWQVILAGAILGAGIGLLLASLQPTEYEGVTTLQVVAPRTEDSQPTVPGFRPFVENAAHASEVVAELGLDKPPHDLSPQAFLRDHVTVEEVRPSNLVNVRVRLADPKLAAEASQRLAAKAIALNQRLNQAQGSSVKSQLKQHLDAARGRLEAAEHDLVTFKQDAQVDLLKEDARAALEERRDLLALVIAIESEKARLAAAEREIAGQERVLSVARNVTAEEALRRSLSRAERSESRDTVQAPPDARQAESAPVGSPAQPAPTSAGRSDPALPPTSGQPRNSSADIGARPKSERPRSKVDLPPVDAETLDLSNPFVNPVYQTLEFQIATSRASLAALERQYRELVHVKKLGGSELEGLSRLYSREIDLARRETNYDLARKVYSELAVRYEESDSSALGASPELQLVDEGLPPDRPISRRRALTTALGALAGLMLAGLLALSLSAHDDSARQASRTA